MHQLAISSASPPYLPCISQVLAAARHAGSVIYLSCNPATLARDLAALETTHHVTDAALFDQFPHTPHAEVGVVLQRRRLSVRGSGQTNWYQTCTKD